MGRHVISFATEFVVAERGHSVLAFLVVLKNKSNDGGIKPDAIIIPYRAGLSVRAIGHGPRPG
jgi:hypothetical protein